MLPSNLQTSAPMISDPLGNGYANITNLAEAVASRLEREHKITRDSVSPNDHEGLHKQGSAIAFFQDSQPLSRLDGVAFTDDDRGVIWIKPMPSLATMTYVELYILTSQLAGVATFKQINTHIDVKVDTLTEKTTNQGVSIEGIHLENDASLGKILDAVDRITASTSVTVGAAVVEPARITAPAFRFSGSTTHVNGDMWIE